MKALSLTQPWASLMARDRKKIETRSWRVYLNDPIEVAIHASKTWTKADREFAEAWNIHAPPLGAIVAVGTLYKILPTLYAHPDALEAAYGDYSPGRWAWFFRDVRSLRVAVPCKGALGLWELPTSVEESVLSVLA